MARGRSVALNVAFSICTAITAALSSIPVVLPTWVNSASTSGSCGPLVYATNRADRTTIAKWALHPADIPETLWAVSGILILVAATFQWIAFVLSIASCCCSNKRHRIVKICIWTIFVTLIIGFASLLTFLAGIAVTNSSSGDSTVCHSTNEVQKQ
eukprot:m.247669 g.247669  ORF g.247669 m.247669 type:complete len:156 (+) comp15398_c0_seq5:165-632(+)